MIIWGRTEEDKKLLERMAALSLKEWNRVEEVDELRDTVRALKEEISGLEVSRSKLTEEFDRKERELRHMIGLEKERMEAERAQHKVEVSQEVKRAQLALREDNLKEEQKRFAEQLKFNTERFEKVEVYLKDMNKSILERLPNVNLKLKG